MPTEGAPAATAARAYSIWTSLPEGLQRGETHEDAYQTVRLGEVNSTICNINYCGYKILFSV